MLGLLQVAFRLCVAGRFGAPSHGCCRGTAAESGARARAQAVDGLNHDSLFGSDSIAAGASARPVGPCGAGYRRRRPTIDGGGLIRLLRRGRGGRLAGGGRAGGARGGCRCADGPRRRAVRRRCQVSGLLWRGGCGVRLRGAGSQSGGLGGPRCRRVCGEGGHRQARRNPGLRPAVGRQISAAKWQRALAGSSLVADDAGRPGGRLGRFVVSPGRRGSVVLAIAPRLVVARWIGVAARRVVVGRMVLPFGTRLPRRVLAMGVLSHGLVARRPCGLGILARRHEVVPVASFLLAEQGIEEPVARPLLSLR